MAKELFAKSHVKVVPFEQNGQFYYRKAKKYMENNNYINALNFYRKAVEKEPENTEYMLDLAEVFTEMGYFEESNRILFSVMQKQSTKADCYFGLGCNFLGLLDYDKAEDCFDKYLDLDPEGIYSEDAIGLLEVLRNYEYFIDYPEVMDPASEKLYKMAGKGKDYLDRGEYNKAIRQLERVIRKEPSLSFAKNNLALAYYCIGKLNKAIELSKQVLENEPQNVHANCNIALFYHQKGEEEFSKSFINSILERQYDDPEEIHKIAVTLCEMKEHEKAYRMLKKLLWYKPYDIRVLHYTAVASFNLGRYKEAFKYWDKIAKIDPYNTISCFYKQLVQGCLKEQKRLREISYHFQVPYDEIIRRVKKINDMLRLNDNDLKKKWEQGNALKSLLSWGLDLNDKVIKSTILSVVASFGDSKAEGFLREFLLRRNEEEDLKKETFGLLKQMNAPEPYIAYVDDNIVEVKVDIVVDDGSLKIPLILQGIPDMVVSRMSGRYENICEIEIRELWERFIRALYPDRLPRARKSEAWAAALELYYCKIHSIDVTKGLIAEHYEITYSTLVNNYKKIKMVLDKC